MLYNQVFRSRRFLLIIGLTTLLIVVKSLFSNSSTDVSKHNNARFAHRGIENKKLNSRIVEITDRQPTFKLYIYKGYDVDFDRYRAQAKLLDDLKLHDKCQQNPKTIVVDVGASLGMINFIFRY